MNSLRGFSLWQSTVVVVGFLVSLYAIAWGWIYLTADRSQALIILGSDGHITKTYPGVPFPLLFPDPGYDTEPLAFAVLVAGLVSLTFALALTARGRRQSS